MQKNFRSFARAGVQKLLSQLGAVAVRETPQLKILQFIQSLRPVDSGHGLIRLGGAGDGGYLIPDDLEGISACFSPGVSETSAFERDCAQRGMHLFLADYSVEQVGPELEGFPYKFSRRFVGPDPAPEFISFPEWLRASTAPEGDWMLQMDIEGGEYPVLLETPLEDLAKFRIICIEFHQLTHLWNDDFFNFVRLAIDRLCVHHRCVHLHANNAGSEKIHRGIQLPDTLEVTFLRKDRMPSQPSLASLPHPLDAPNVAHLPELKLSSMWA